MAFATKSLAVVAFLAFLPLGACATQPAGGYGAAGMQGEQGAYAQQNPMLIPARMTAPAFHDGLLSSPPNNARPGECYAKVVVPGQPIGAPPPQQRAVWVQTPPGPGQISPTWCIYYLPGAPQPVVMSPERYGWIRVVCDKDATEEKIRHVQRRLHEWGDYDGAYDGHFDHATAQGVTRFQAQRHIEHGGYLSVKTVEDLDGAPPQGTLVQAFDEGRPNPNATIYASPIYQGQNAQQGYPSTLQPAPSVAPCGPVACGAPPPVAYAPPQIVYAPPPPPQIIYRQSPPQVVVQRVIQPVYQQVYAPAPPPQVIYRQSPPQVIYQPSPPQTVIQPVYQPIYSQAPQMGCGQPACMPQPQPYPCGGPVCGASGGQGWGGQGGGYPQGTPPYRALLTWSGKTTY